MPSSKGLVALVIGVLVLCCCTHNVVAQGDVATCRPPASALTDNGIGIISDASCNVDISIRSTACLDTQCRFCQVFRSDLSKIYHPCSSPLSLTLPIVVVGGTGTAPRDNSTPGPTPVAATAATTAPTPAPTSAAWTPTPTPAPATAAPTPAPAPDTSTPILAPTPAETTPIPTPTTTTSVPTPALTPTTTAPTPEPITSPPTPAETTVAPTPAETTSAPTPALAETRETPAPVESTTPAPTPAFDPELIDCTTGFTAEAMMYGIYAVLDLSCATEVESTSCKDDYCRLCFVVKTEYSESYPECSTLF